MNTVSPHAFISTEELQARLKRVLSAEDDVEQRLTDAVNAATDWMEMATRRKLRARNHRTANTVAFTASSGATAYTAGVTTALYVGDDMTGAGVGIGSQVSAIGSGTALTASRKTTAALSGTNVTFGSRPLRCSGDGTNELYLPERPIVQVFSIYDEVNGVQTALDLSNAVYDYDVGRILLANDTFPKGNLNLVVNARLGYAEPSATDLGHPSFFTLESLAMRVAEVFFTDALQIRGRAQDIAAGGLSTTVGAAPMPADIVNSILPFVRRW